MSGGGRRYGVQVGNETYSLVLTQEDWEKRRLDREHARKLSLANNKRRKALDDRKKVAEARENRKRELELFKRRQRQIEATERYQRFHITAKDKRQQNSDFTQDAPNLEEVLQKLRGGDGDGIVGTIPQTEKPAIATTQENQEDIVKNQPPGVIMERVQWQNMKEYAEDLKRQIFSIQHKEDQTSDKIQDAYLNDDDGQDSLHGSSVSGSSQPSYSSPTVTPAFSESSEKLAEEFRKQSPALQETDIQEAGIPDKLTQPALNPEVNHTPQDDSHIGIVRGSETGVLCKRDSQTGRITYYVKAYRPWSATVVNKPFQNAFHHNQAANSLLIRPSSSYDSRKRTPSSDYTSAPKSPQRHYDSWTSSNPSGHIVQHSNKLSEKTEEDNKITNSAPRSVTFSDPIATHVGTRPAHSYSRQVSSAPIVGRTTATPVSPYFDSGRDRSGGVIITVPGSQSSASIPLNPTTPVTSETGPGPRATVTFSQTPVSVDAVKVLNQVTEKEKSAAENSENENGKAGLKGILRRYSKYDTSRYGSQPAYQSAGIARQKWLHGITLGPRNDSTKERRVRSAETTKSVRWHQVHYNDGSPSSTLDIHENIPPSQPILTPKPQPPSRVQGVSSARGAKSPRKPSTARPKTSPAKGMRGGKVKGSGRRLRPAKELPVNIIPHPPPQKQAPKLSMSTVINYSIDPGEDTNAAPKKLNNGKTAMKPRPSSSNKRMSPITHNKIVFHRKVKSENGEAVTMSTLKSRGNEARSYDNGRDSENIVVSQGNQVTINVSSTKPIVSTPSSARRVAIESGRIPLNGTPTDQEIEMLWDKVRSYLAWNKSRGNGSLVKKIRGVPERKVAWGPSQTDIPQKHISANIISIDGGIFGKPGNDESAFVTSQNPAYKTSHQMPVHYERFGIAKSRKVAYSPSIPSQEYAYSSNHVPHYQIREKARGSLPITTNGHVHPSSAPVRRQPQLTESVRTFRLVEALIEQNVPEEEILRALNSLQSATREV